MKQSLKILIVDDHQLIIEGYKAILLNQSQYDFNIVSTSNCRDASKIIIEGKHHFDIAIFDWILPSFGKFNDGGDLAILVKKYMPSTKTIIITSHEEAFELYDITKRVKPAGLLVKSDFGAEDLLLVIHQIYKGNIYYSNTVQHSIEKINSRGMYLDNYNRQIISLLSKGIKTKSIPNYLPLSISAIDKRKSQIKDYFLINGGNDEDILREAKKIGLI